VTLDLWRDQVRVALSGKNTDGRTRSSRGYLTPFPTPFPLPAEMFLVQCRLEDASEVEITRLNTVFELH